MLIGRQLTLPSILALTLTSCATIVDGTTQVVSFNSNPSGAEIVLNGVPIGVTPFTSQIERGENKVVLVKKEGYDDQQVMLSTKLNGWFWGNFLFGGLLGSTTDYASGASIEYAPNTYYVTLIPKKASQMERGILEKNMWTRNFILVGYSNLAADLASGDGEYLSSLYRLLNIEEENGSVTLGHMRKLFARHRNVPAFAEAVVERFACHTAS